MSQVHPTAVVYVAHCNDLCRGRLSAEHKDGSPTADIYVVGQSSDLEKPAIDPSTTLSVAEATRRLGVGRARVYQLIEAGALDTVGTQPVRITLDSLERRRNMSPTVGAPLASLSAWAVLALA